MLSGNIMNWFNYNMTRSNNMTTVPMNDDITRAIALTFDKKSTWPAPRPPAPPAPPKKVEESDDEEDMIEELIEKRLTKRTMCFNSNLREWITMVAFAAIFAVLVWTAPAEFLDSLMAIILGA